jgi:hypothetical protein
VWLCVVAPLIGGVRAALAYRYFIPEDEAPTQSTAVAEGEVERTAATP